MIWIILNSALFFSYVSCGTEFLFEQALLEPYASEPLEIYLGKKLKLSATATFAEGESTAGVVIELLPSLSVENTVLALGEILSYTIGSQLTTPDTAMNSVNFETHVIRHKSPESEDGTLKQRFDNRAVFNIGTVTSNGAGTADEDNQIKIEFEVVYVSTGGNADGTEHQISSGEEYNGGDYVWISVITIVLKDSAGTSSSETSDPTFNVETGATTIDVSVPKTIDVTINSPRSASPLKFEAVSMNDGADIFIMKLMLKSVGEAYAFSTVKENIFIDAYDTCPLSTSLELDLGTPINKESKENSPVLSTYALVIEATVLVDNPDLVGEDVSLGLGLDIHGTEVWVSDVNLTVTAGTTPQVTTFDAVVKTGFETVSPGFPAGVEIEVTVPRGSNNDINFDLSTVATSVGANALSILSITPTTHGNNIPCDIPSSAVNPVYEETVSGSGLIDHATLTVNISNINMQPSPDADSDIYRFDVYVMILPSASKDETFSLKMSVNGLTEKSVSITAGAPTEYHDVNYTFSIANDCASNTHHAGSTLSFKMTVETQRSLTAGNMTIETPIPDVLTSPYLSFVDARVISKGKNVPCVSLGEISKVLSNWVENSGDLDRAVLTFPLICNVEIVNDTLEDTFVIEFKATIKDVTNTSTAEFGVGAKIGNKIWVASYSFDIKAALDNTVTKRVNGIIVAEGEGPPSWPGDLKVQWSDDNVSFYEYNYQFSTGMPGVGETMYELNPPLYARYVRLINTDGGICTNYTLNTTDISDGITFHGATASSELMTQRVMFILDQNNSTCMSLPTPATNDTAKYYWGNFNTTILGADGTSAFNLQLVGNGLNCSSRAGPQVTLVMYPKDSDTLAFVGKKKKCSLLNETPGRPMTCLYECACSDTVTCADVTLVLYYNGKPEDAYELCDVTVV